MPIFGKHWIEDSEDCLQPTNVMTHWKDGEDKEDVSAFSHWKDEPEDNSDDESSIKHFRD